MNSNIETISLVVDYIDKNLSSELTLEQIADKAGYSKYHLHRMFSCIVGQPINSYIKRRKLTEAARELALTNKSILDIALDTGYTSQQAFSNSFKKLFKKSPDRYRKTKIFIPIQLKYEYDQNAKLHTNRAIDITIINTEVMTILGYKVNTAKGFWVIGVSHNKLEKVKANITSRSDYNVILGLNDYSEFESNESGIAFDYYAGVEIDKMDVIPKGMTSKILPPSNYVIFSFIGDKKSSMQDISTYIYTKWFPESSYIFNENAMYDFIKYYEEIDDRGNSKIEYWVPVI